MAIQSMGGAEAGWEVACEVSVPLWVQTPSKALPLLACWRRTPSRCPFGHCWMRDHHPLRSHESARIGGVTGHRKHASSVGALLLPSGTAPFRNATHRCPGATSASQAVSRVSPCGEGLASVPPLKSLRAAEQSQAFETGASTEGVDPVLRQGKDSVVERAAQYDMNEIPGAGRRAAASKGLAVLRQCKQASQLLT